MRHLLQSSRKKVYAAFAAIAALILAVVLVLTNTDLGHNLFPGRAYTTDYRIVLDEDNAVSSSGDVVQHTKRGSEVTFTYSNVSSYSSGHTKLNNGGTLVNKTQITSVTEITAEFNTSGSLRFRTSYDGATWGGYATMTSGETYELGSQPYYIEFSALDNYVEIDSIDFYFTCQANPSADPHQVVEAESWRLVKSTSELKANDEVLVVAYNSSTEKYYALRDEELNTYYLKCDQITINSDETATYTSQHIWTLKSTGSSTSWKFKHGSDYLYADVNGTHYNAMVKTTEDNTSCVWGVSITNSGVATIHNTNPGVYLTYLYYKGTSHEFTGRETTPTVNHYIYKHYPATSHDEWDEPVDLIGISATFNNDLNEDSIFDNVGNVQVTGHYSDGSYGTISSGYTTKVVVASTEKEIDTSEPFGYDSRPGGMDYTLVVEYGTFIPLEYNFTVGQNIYVTDIESTFDIDSNVTVNTANSFNDFIGNYEVTLTLRRGNPISNIKYTSFSNYSEYGLSLDLLTPAGVSYDKNTAFGTPGTWTLRTTTTKNACVDESTFEVHAIPVSSIVVGGTLSVEETKTTQLTLDVSPNNATNPNVIWSSSNTSVATVNSSGLVTGVSAGETTITATAADNSGVFGQVTVEVTEKTFFGYERVTSSSIEDGSYVVFSNTKDDGSALIMDKQKYDKNNIPTNRDTASVTIANGVIEELPTDGYEFRVTKNSDNSYSFYDSVNNGYLAAQSEAKNYLITTASINDASKFTFTYGSSGDTIVSKASYDRIYMRYNPNTGSATGSPLFSLYGSSSSITDLPYVFVRSGAKVYPTSISLSGDSTVSVGSTTTIGVIYQPSGVNVKNVTWRSSDETVATVSGGVVTGVKAGTATIYARAETKTGYTAEVSKQITVSNVAVTSVSLNKTSGTINVGGTVTLTPTISPSNATNKAVTWSTSNSSIATVVDGLVTGVAAGTATITVRTQDGNKTATFTVTVVTSGGGGGGGSGASEWTLVTSDSALSAGDVIVIASYSAGTIAGDLSSQILSSETSGLTFADSSTITALPDNALQLTLGGSAGSWTLSNSDGQLLGATAVKKLAWDSGNTNWTISISGGSATIENNTSSYGRFLCNASATPRYTTYTSATSSTMLLPEIYIGGSAEPVDPTGITLNPTSLELAAGQSSKINATILPSGANQNKTITWSSSNTSVATVTDGTVEVKSGATAGQTATITAKLNEAPNKPQATATLTVVEQQEDAWTILVYMCGSDLESDGGYATGDIAEMLQLRNSQPDNVNVIIQTGGSTKWQNYSISASKIGRYKLEPGKSTPTLVTQLNQANMGNSSTLQSFIEWGVNNYPAQKTGLIFWNHGGALDGCCWDDNYGSNGDPLTQSERLTGIKNAYNNLGRTQPFEWVGYDCCLMAVQDIAEFDSPYFKYSVASQESEAGAGWDYDNWMDDLYAGKDTETVLKAIVDSFIAEQGSKSDQTLSVLNLQNMAAYNTAWESMASALSTNEITSSSKFSTMKDYVNTAVKYGYSSSYNTAVNNYGYVYDIFNVSDVLSKFKTNYSSCSSQISAAQTALNNLVVYNKCGTKAKTSCGVCCFFPISQYGTSSYYTTSITHFTTWRTLCFKY